MDTKEVVEFIKLNNEGSIKEYHTIIRENLLQINSYHRKNISLIVFCSVIYILFALQVTDTLDFSFISINKPVVIDYLFPPIYMFLIVRFIIMEDKLVDYLTISGIITIVSLKFPKNNTNSGDLIYSVLPYNFLLDINRRGLSGNMFSFKQILSFLPIYSLYVLPVALAFYSFYRLALHFCDHPKLIIADLVFCFWLVVSAILIGKETYQKSVGDPIKDEGNIVNSTDNRQ